MEKQEIFDKVKEILADKMGVDECDIKPESRFEADLGGDSLDVVEFVMEVESEFGISVPDEEFPDTLNFTVQDACDRIECYIK
jgi:acyl carrier protein